MKAIIAGIVLGAATLVFASHSSPTKHNGVWPTPLCPPSQPNCPLNQ